VLFLSHESKKKKKNNLLLLLLRATPTTMASLLANGISSFSPQPTSDSSKSPKGFHPKPESLKFPSPKSLNPTRPIFKLRADVGIDSRPIGASESSSSGTSTVSSTDKLQQYFQNLDYDKKYGFVEDIDSFTIPKGLSEETIRLISKLKEEPDWMLEFRFKAYAKFLKLEEPKWSDNRYPSINFQDMCYYSAPKKKPTLNSLDEVDPQLLEYFDKLGVPLTEQKRLANVAVDAVIDSVSIATTHRKTLEKSGVIFCSISEAIREYPDLIKKYLGRVVPSDDNYYAALNSAVFSDGSFCYIPKNTRCPMPISTYFRINAMETGQFERTLIVAEEGSFVEYLEGCTAPSYDTNQLHAAVVELYCGKGAEIKYSTVQNWYAGDEQGKGGIYNFVTKRGLCAGDRSKISWTQVETGSAITWKYPSVVLEGDDSVGEFYSVALTNNYQQADTGTKMIHKGKNTKSRIISKGISAGHSRNCYRGLVQVQSKAEGAKNTSTCDSMLIGDKAAANTYPYIQVKNPSAKVEHEASTSKIGEDQLFYFQQRGIDHERALAAMISGFCRDVFNKLPDEFGAEVNQLMSIKLEGSVG
jgi:FeS assembly protein SufB